MKTIYDLLKQSNYPNAWIQGHHTRIVMYDESGAAWYEVLQKDKDGRYTLTLYVGIHEEAAIMAFEQSETE